MKRKILIAVIDAGSSEYFLSADIPNIRQMIKSGFMKEVSSVIPSVTNVNNVSIVCGAWPEVHGITANYWHNPQTGAGTYMESPEFLLAENLFQKSARSGLKSAVFTSKNKLKLMLEQGASFSVSAENPAPGLVSAVGPAEDVYSAGINHWLYRALHHKMKEEDFDIHYISTTDYVMHKYPPEHEVSISHMNGIDSVLGMILNDYPDMEVYMTADHGMNPKSRAVNLLNFLARENISAEFIPVIKDKYVVHHENLGGIAYIYLDSEYKNLFDKTRESASAILGSIAGVEKVYSREEAASVFHLMPERIGDIVVLGDIDTVFSEFDEDVREISIRSHGSTYEGRVPVIAYNSKTSPSDYSCSIDIAGNLQH